ncbi:FeoA domain-containing protein [Nitratiruptor sp. YY09-18]|uniref:FeoA family protein n=1 Tax=Nitratiruptor sp. YY09-18 TaxID=2724901 RepID=UPI00191580D0|nr:FeoA domain-containing protein [Nitratiruptor sp. YY09-18]BCD68702.1 ferrous iron transport protein A [Nitratiruptor sp. YY09-18]
MPLTMASVGRKLKIVDIRGGRKAIDRLLAMGISPGIEIKLLKNDGGPLLVKLGESRIALGFGLADKIIVEEEE